jgi:serine/threonine protein kinase
MNPSTLPHVTSLLSQLLAASIQWHVRAIKPRADAPPVPLQRILALDYKIPPHIAMTRECRDLFSKIFVVDPAERITIAGIKAHPWFLQDLEDEQKVPPGTRVSGLQLLVARSHNCWLPDLITAGCPISQLLVARSHNCLHVSWQDSARHGFVQCGSV